MGQYTTLWPDSSEYAPDDMLPFNWSDLPNPVPASIYYDGKTTGGNNPTVVPSLVIRIVLVSQSKPVHGLLYFLIRRAATTVASLTHR